MAGTYKNLKFPTIKKDFRATMYSFKLNNVGWNLSIQNTQSFSSVIFGYIPLKRVVTTIP